jgi:hypothetical protein
LAVQTHQLQSIILLSLEVAVEVVRLLVVVVVLVVI